MTQHILVRGVPIDYPRWTLPLPFVIFYQSSPMPYLGGPFEVCGELGDQWMGWEWQYIPEAYLLPIEDSTWQSWVDFRYVVFPVEQFFTQETCSFWRFGKDGGWCGIVIRPTPFRAVRSFFTFQNIPQHEFSIWWRVCVIGASVVSSYLDRVDPELPDLPYPYWTQYNRWMPIGSGRSYPFPVVGDFGVVFSNQDYHDLAFAT